MEAWTEPLRPEPFETIAPASLTAREPAPDAALVHGTAGRWYIGLGRVGAFFGFLFLVAELLAATGVVTLPKGAPVLTPLDLVLYGIGLAAIERVLRGLDEFESVSWWVTMATLAFGLATGAYSVAVVSRVGGVVGFVVTAVMLLPDLVWMRYFWSRREDFEIGL